MPLRTEEEVARHDEAWLNILNIKRMNNMAKYGVTMPDGNIAKIDVRPLDQIRRILELMKAQPDKWGFVIIDTPHDACDNCGKPTKGTKIGASDNIVTFSFCPTKNLDAFGDAGMVTTNNDDFAVMLRAFREHGMALSCCALFFCPVLIARKSSGVTVPVLLEK